MLADKERTQSQRKNDASALSLRDDKYDRNLVPQALSYCYGIKIKDHSGRFQQLLYKALAEEIITVSKAAALSHADVDTITKNLQLI